MGKAIGEDTDAGVPDGEVQDYSCFRLFPEDHLDPDLSLIGKFYGVTEKIGQDLVQPVRITGQPVGNGGVDDRFQQQALLLQPVIEDGCCVAQYIFKAEGYFFNIELAGLDLGEVEDIAQDDEQVINGAFDDAGQLVLLAGKRSAR